VKLSEEKTKIIGVSLGELSLNVLMPDKPNGLKVRLALLADNGPIGVADFHGFQFSEKVHKAIEALVTAIEEEGLGFIFKIESQASETPENKDGNDPPQF
jgi:hypothetical protein